MEARDQIPVTPEDQVLAILRQAKYLAQEYRQLTGKPLGITGEGRNRTNVSGAMQQSFSAVETGWRRMQS